MAAEFPELAALSARIDQIKKEEDERKAQHERNMKASWCYQCTHESLDILCKGDCCLFIYKKDSSCWSHPCCLPCECVHGLLCCLPACCVGCIAATSDGCCRTAEPTPPSEAAPQPVVMD
jgi:hypothetical protein